MRTTRTRAGFTLIELLVVIAIIAILIGLLLPAVQKVREAAARMQCSNNLKQLAIAAHSYHDANLFMPQNASPIDYGHFDNERGWSWIATILPYIEQGNLYNQGNLGATFAARPTFEAVAAVHATQIKTLLCPSDPDNGTARRDAANGSTSQGCGITNYKGVNGNRWEWGTFATYSSGGQNWGLDSGNGIFYRSDSRRKLTIVGITDGTTNTLMVGEDLVKFNTHLGWPRSNYATGTTAIPLNNAMRSGQPGFNDPTNWPEVYSFRSRHTGGANFAMGDGSVRFLRDSIAIASYRAAGSIDGGEVVNLD